MACLLRPSPARPSREHPSHPLRLSMSPSNLTTSDPPTMFFCSFWYRSGLVSPRKSPGKPRLTQNSRPKSTLQKLHLPQCRRVLPPLLSPAPPAPPSTHAPLEGTPPARPLFGFVLVGRRGRAGGGAVEPVGPLNAVSLCSSMARGPAQAWHAYQRGDLMRIWSVSNAAGFRTRRALEAASPRDAACRFDPSALSTGREACMPPRLLTRACTRAPDISLATDTACSGRCRAGVAIAGMSACF